MEIRKIIREILNENLTLVRGEGKNDSGNVDLFGRGLYLTDDLEVARFYGDSIKHFEVSGKIFDTEKPFTSSELRKFIFHLDRELKTDVGSRYLQEIIDYNEGLLSKITDVDYIGVSWALDSKPDFFDVLVRSNLVQNDFNSYANSFRIE